MEDDVASVMGTKIMVDYTGATMNHLVQASPSMVKKMMAVCQVRNINYGKTIRQSVRREIDSYFIEKDDYDS